MTGREADDGAEIKAQHHNMVHGSGRSDTGVEAFTLTIIESEKWTSYAEDMSMRVVYETGPRGDITDRNGTLLGLQPCRVLGEYKQGGYGQKRSAGLGGEGAGDYFILR